MRLIDAEALQDDGANYVWSRFADCSLIKQEIRFVNREQIDNAPTVEAIPIEWIKKYIDERDAKLPTKEQYVPYDLWEIAALELLIDTWEAENGIQ